MKIRSIKNYCSICGCYIPDKWFTCPACGSNFIPERETKTNNELQTTNFKEWEINFKEWEIKEIRYGRFGNSFNGTIDVYKF